MHIHVQLSALLLHEVPEDEAPHPGGLWPGGGSVPARLRRSELRVDKITGIWK